jgi:hypothetical protein
MEVSTAGSSNSYASVLNPLESGNPSPKQKEITRNDNNKENIPGKILTDKDDQRTTTEKPKENDNVAVDSKPNEELDESGFVPVVAHGKKDKKMRQMERRGGDTLGKGPKSATSKSQERPEKPKRNRRDRKAAKDKAAASGSVAPPVNHQDSSDADKAADSSDGATDKKLKFVEAPLPQVNPWVSPTTTLFE